MPESKQDRELIELLNELRVALPGVQVMFAFLLMVPFSQGWPKTSATQQWVYFASFFATAIATVFLIAPTSYHRLRWRAHDKEHMLVASNRFAIVGTVFLSIAMSCVVFFVTDYIYPNTPRSRRRSSPASRVAVVRASHPARVAGQNGKVISA